MAIERRRSEEDEGSANLKRRLFVAKRVSSCHFENEQEWQISIRVKM